MKTESSDLFACMANINKNSHDFDLMILEQLKQIKVAPKHFNKAVRKIMKQKSNMQLWWCDKLTKVWVYNHDEKKGNYYDVNYRCCPVSRKAQSYFCLMLSNTEKEISVIDGWLQAV